MRHTKCKGCPRKFMSHTEWRTLTPAERDHHRAAGLVNHEARGLCPECYRRCRADGTLVDYERTTVPTDLAVEEWLAWDGREGMTRAAAVRVFAPRMDMKPEALERALDRAGVRGPAPQASAFREAIAQHREPNRCRKCITKTVSVTMAEDEVRKLAGKLAADPDSRRLTLLLAKARADVASQEAWLALHMDTDHAEDVAA